MNGFPPYFLNELKDIRKVNLGRIRDQLQPLTIEQYNKWVADTAPTYEAAKTGKPMPYRSVKVNTLIATQDDYRSSSGQPIIEGIIARSANAKDVPATAAAAATPEHGAVPPTDRYDPGRDSPEVDVQANEQFNAYADDPEYDSFGMFTRTPILRER